MPGYPFDQNLIPSVLADPLFQQTGIYCRESVGVSQGSPRFNGLGTTNETAGLASLSWRSTGLHSSHVRWHWPTIG
jgi:hypothetical protein